MKPIRIAVFFVVAFSSIIVPVALGMIIGFANAPAPFALNEAALGNTLESGSRKSIFEERTAELTGVVRALVSPDERVVLYHFADADAARQGMREIVREIQKSSVATTPGSTSYTRADGTGSGRVVWAGEWVVWTRGATQTEADSLLEGLPFVSRRQNSGWITRFLWWILAGIGVYIVFLAALWLRLATWAATIDPDRETDPVPESELRRRIREIDDLDSPLVVEDGKRPGELVVTWNYADSHWAGVFQAGGVRRLARMRLRFDERTHSVRSQDQTVAVDWEALAAGRAAFRVRGFRGIVFTSYDRGVGYGHVFRNGRLVFDKTYDFRFSMKELRGPVVDLITESGWRLRPAVVL